MLNCKFLCQTPFQFDLDHVYFKVFASILIISPNSSFYGANSSDWDSTFCKGHRNSVACPCARTDVPKAAFCSACLSWIFTMWSNEVFLDSQFFALVFPLYPLWAEYLSLFLPVPPEPNPQFLGFLLLILAI